MLKLLLSLMLATLLLGTASAQEMGAAMIAYDEGNAPRLVTANQSAGSVTLLERDSGKRIKEVQLGICANWPAQATALCWSPTTAAIACCCWMMISSWQRRSPPAIALRGHLRSQAAVVLGQPVRGRPTAGL